MYFGVDYYPEHWTREEWGKHAEQMKEANINIVRLAEFAWAKLEPTEEKYDFEWLDEAIGVLAKEDIKVVIGTPTATPPKWLMDKHPDIYMKDFKGIIRGFGTRRHYCYNSKNYHEFTKRIVSEIAEHYKDHPSVVAWQIDNEFGGGDGVRCYCENCLKAFREWLKIKYKNIQTLNTEWGTIFWSQTYGSWNELILPGYSSSSSENGNSHNPGMLLDYYRFSSDSVIKYQRIQIDEIQKYSTQPITHNMMGHFQEIDYFELGKDLDFVSWDSYPGGPWPGNSHQCTSMQNDLMRGIKNLNFWIMEQQSGPCGWNFMGDMPKPGQIRLWTYQSIAHGAEAVIYFRWKACTFGTEEYWYGILDHDGVPRRRYHEVQKTGSELKALSDMFLGSKLVAEVAIIKSYDNLWSHRFQTHNKNFDYSNLLLSYYSAIAANHVNIDMTSIEADFSKYKVVFMPAFNVMKDSIRKKVEEYVNDGGNIVLSFRSGTKNWNNSMTTETLPGYFREVAGIEVEEFDVLNWGREVGLKGSFGEGKASLWCDIINPISAEVMAEYSNDYFEGQAAVTVNKYGKGKVYYIGCDLDAKSLERLIRLILNDSYVTPILKQPIEGVELIKREKGGNCYFIALNYNNHPVSLDLGENYMERITGKEIKGLLELKPYEVAVLE